MKDADEIAREAYKRVWNERLDTASSKGIAYECARLAQIDALKWVMELDPDGYDNEVAAKLRELKGATSAKP